VRNEWLTEIKETVAVGPDLPDVKDRLEPFG
jgi:hypothetical protein